MYSPLHPPSNPFHDLMNCIVYMCMCVEREKERKRISSPSSLLLKLKLCYHSSALSTHPTTTRQPASNRFSFRVRIPTLQLRQSFSSLYLSFPIPETRLRTLYNILPLPLLILHKDCFCSFSYFLFFFFISHLFLLLLFCCILLFLQSRPSYHTPLLHTCCHPSRSYSRFYLFIFIFFLCVFCIAKNSTFHFCASACVACVRRV